MSGFDFGETFALSLIFNIVYFTDFGPTGFQGLGVLFQES